MNSIKNLTFLCDGCKEKLANDPSRLVDVWSRLMDMGKDCTEKHDWNKAVVHYRNAFEVAVILFNKSPDNDGIHRFMNTTTEFIYALRHCTYRCDLPLFISIVKDHLTNNLYPAKIGLLLKQATDIAYLPLSELHQKKTSGQAIKRTYVLH